VRRDVPRYRSPDAGYPEAAMAGSRSRTPSWAAAGVRRPPPTFAALTLYRGADALLIVVNAGVTLPVLVARHR